MKKRLIHALLLPLALFASPPDYTEYGRLLEAYVKPDGVDYRNWYSNAADLAALDSVLEQFAAVDAKALAKNDAKAFYINLYNAAMVQVVLDEYPIQSVTKIGMIPFGVFKKNFIHQGTGKLSLDDVEKGILLKQYPDPRIHFAVNCASISCPPLASVPYTGAGLEEQLDSATRAFAVSEQAARVDKKRKTVYFSKLFDWYASDFGTRDPAEYLNRYRENPLPTKQQVKWIDYDWGLNESGR